MIGGEVRDDGCGAGHKQSLFIIYTQAIKRSVYGAEEDRTPDLFNAIEALSQLSYSPTNSYLEPEVDTKHVPIILQRTGTLQGRWLRNMIVSFYCPQQGNRGIHIEQIHSSSSTARRADRNYL